MKTNQLLAGACFAAVSLAPSLHAAAQPVCGEFSFYGDYVEVHHADHGESGAGHGDARHGHGQLLDQDGNEIGLSYFHSVVGPGADEQYFRMIGVAHYEFSNGSIITSSTYELPHPAHNAPPPDSGGYSAVIGGTGEFAGARGVIQWVDDEDGNRRGDVIIECLD